MENQNQPTGKKKMSLKTIVLIVVAVIVVCALLGIIFGQNDPEGSTSSSTTSSAVTNSSVSAEPSEESGTQVASSEAAVESTPEAATEPYTAELSSGNYTSGIDFPEGTYTITAISGSGNVSSDNMYSGGLNALMATEEDDMYVKEFKNAELPKGTVLRISGVTVQISTDAADSSTMEARQNTATEEVTLSSGNFVSGTDFAAGTYDIIAISGSGNVSSDNMFDGGLNAVMAPTADDLYETEYKNIELPEGTTLTVSGVEIQLVPSK